MPAFVNRSNGAALALCVVLGAALVNACSTDVEVGQDDPAAAGSGGQGGAVAMGGGSGTGGSGTGGSGTGGSGGEPACRISECQGKTYACGNCTDDDDDGLIDARDPDCLGPCDNTENSFFGGIPGQSGGGCRQDCYFDNDSGSGNDGCDWSHACDPLSIAPAYPPSGAAQCAFSPNTMVQGQSCMELAAAQATQCTDVCKPLIPNGCDCFGCCELPSRSGNYVWLGSNVSGVGTCTRDSLDDPSACRPCTPVPACQNSCELCEICAGDTRPDPSCGGTTPVCEPGSLPCGPGATCADQYYCISGCCASVPR